MQSLDLSGKMNLRRSIFIGNHAMSEAALNGGDEKSVSIARINFKEASSGCSGFYIIGEKSLRSGATGTRVIGRDSEIQQCLMFMFGSDTFAASRSKATERVFALDNRASYVILRANKGMGKASVANTITHHIYTMAKKVSAYNIQLFKSQTSAYTQSTPYSAKTSEEAARGRRRSLAASFSSINTELDLAVTYLFETHLKDWAEYKALISRITHVEEDTEAVAALKLGEIEMNARLMSLATAIVQVFPIATGKLAFIAMTDIERFDDQSQTLLLRLHEQGVGLVMLLTSQQHGQASLDKTRLLEIDISSLDQLSVAATVGNVLSTLLKDSGLVLPTVNDATLQVIFEVSKGNPTYVYEI
eukprot:gene42884-53207_t